MIRIVADSSTLYSVSEGNTKGINIAPLSVTIDNRTYKEFEEIQSKEFVGCTEELANNAKKIILDNIPNADVELFELSPVFITQGGPGCLAIQMIKKY